MTRLYIRLMSSSSDSRKPDAWKSVDWFPQLAPSRPPRRWVATLAKLAVGLVVGALFFASGRRGLGIFIWSVASVISLISLASSRAEQGLGRLFATLGTAIAKLLSVVMLAPVFYLVLVPVRLFNRVTGADPLRLRRDDRRTFWVESASDAAKRRHVGSMFSIEPRQHQPRRLVGFIVAAAMLVIGAEVVLRLMGVGNPILYVNDAQVGFYPAPNQSVQRYGNRVSTNSFGMRAPEISAQKKAGTFRILMIGDSTLWGGSYIDQQGLYARRVEQALNVKAKEQRVEVLNIGVNAWGPFHKLGYIQKFGTFDADVAVICMPYGDIFRPALPADESAVLQSGSTAQIGTRRDFWTPPVALPSRPNRRAYQ